ncbi:GAF domain-containing protein [Aliamphritea spongicola]|uniref:GAF domain-containing protein n=1 Tax=Aliamphritea spongicola TaxID=707589 RepID=UPI00196A352E|nr:GAF domain-containing protein [Aliamphritea spongicola]MBN3562905.1 GAF domain-containing protein [Aliamphritea spongicola]
MQLDGLLQGETSWISNLANTSALLWMYLPDINWVGFYIRKEDELVLGPFQGKPACTRIPIGKGVCGTAAETMESQLVMDVHEFPGHIACDTESNSEVVIPIVRNGKLIAVLDVDSPEKARFTKGDVEGLEKVVEIILRHQTTG